MVLQQGLNTLSKKSQKIIVSRASNSVHNSFSVSYYSLITTYLALSNSRQLLIWQREAESVFITGDSYSLFIVILHFSMSNLRLHLIFINTCKKLVMISKVLQPMNLRVGNPHYIHL